MFERVGITSFINGCEGDEVDLLGYKTKFRNVVCKVVSNAVNSGSWFSFCTRVSDSQTDIMKFKNSSGDSLGSLVAESFSETVYRSAIYKYLLLDYMCYVESPLIRKNVETNGFKNSFDKFLATSNIEVVALWMGITVEEAMIRYGSSLMNCVEDNECDMFPYVKLWEDKQGNHKVTKPRNEIDLGKSGTRVIPVFALKQGVDLLFDKASEGFYEVMFKKDSGQERGITITFKPALIREIYGDNDFFRNGVETMYSGDFLLNPNMGRGYIRVFEVGGSVYDSPTRSINYARILSIKEIDKDMLDLSYVNIDLGSVLQTFITNVTLQYKKSKQITEAIKDFDLSGSNKLSSYASSNDLEYWANSQVTLLSTTFLRELALFMLANPQWFDGYTGSPKCSKANASSESTGATPDFEFEFDMG